MFKIKFPKAEQLQRQAFKYNRKAFKKVVVGYIKSISKTIKPLARTGHKNYQKTFSENNCSNAFEIFLAFRWYRRHSGLNVTLKEKTCESNTKRRYIDEMDVFIKW